MRDFINSKEHNEEMLATRKEGAVELFKYLVESALERSENGQEITKVMEFVLPMGREIQLNYLGDYGIFTLVDVKNEHGYPKFLENNDYESFYLEILRELNYIRQLED